MLKYRIGNSTLVGLIVLVLSLLFFSSCTEKDVPVFRVANDGFEITHVTTGVINADTIVAVRFSADQAQTGDLQKELVDNIFAFTPEIPGKAYWQDTRTLVFEPSEPLYQKMNYHAVLDLTKVFSNVSEGEPQEIEFHFETLGQKVTALKGQFELAAVDKPETVRFSVNIAFAEQLSTDALRESLHIELEGKILSYELRTEDNRSFTIESEELQRYRMQDRMLIVRLNAVPVHLDERIEEEYILTALDAPLTVLRMEEEKTNEFSKLRVIFSDSLDEKRDYQGYLSISPPIEYDVRVENNSLLISGEFRPREKYSVHLFPGIAGKYGQKLGAQKDYLWEVEISDRNPAVEFVNSGMFLTSSKEKKIAFRTMNVERLRLQVKRVQEENLIAFFEENSYRPGSYSFDEYNRYLFRQFGEVVEDKIVEISTEGNKWIQSELDLSSVITEHDNALYIIQLDFDENQVLYLSEDYDRWQISSYLNQRGRAVKHLLVSDIGITAKEMLGDLHVFLTDLLTIEPIANAVVMLKDATGKILDTAYTNHSGLASLQSVYEGRYIEVRAGDEFAIMSLSSSTLNNSVFDIGGVQKQDGVNAFIYTERGVYRPGDSVNVSAIVRNEDNTFPDKHPVRLSLYNPQDRLTYEEVITEAVDGFYSFNFQTERTALTGMWRAVLDVGGRSFAHQIRIEEVVPYRIRIGIEATPERLEPEDVKIDFTVQSEYLFGAAASGLDSETIVAIEPYDVEFATYNSFVFGNDSLGFGKVESNTLEYKLDEKGKADLSWDIPMLNNVPSALRLRIDSKVYETGGRSVPSTKLIPIEHYSSYVGIMRLENPELTVGEEVNFNVVHLSKEGEPISGTELEYTVYRMRSYWWWEYDSQASFRRHFKSSEETVVVETGILTTNQEGMAYLEQELNDYGEILLEVKDPKGGHTAAYFFRSYWWGDSAENRSADIVNLRLDKKEYRPQETAFVSLNTPARGRALLTVEKEGDILYQSWQEITSTESVFEVEVKEEYIPNAYISILVYQPYGETGNDLPLRMHGITPLLVLSEGTKLQFELELPETIRPKEKLTVEIQTTDQKAAQFTVSVVDEGLLDLTGFKTPRPWDYFFSKQRLLTKTYDNFSDIIDLTRGYSHNLLSVGGDGSEEPSYQQLQAQTEDALRFEPVSVFQGPLQTDQSGYAEVSFEIPNYIGSLRVMVVGADQGKYGSSADTVVVKSPLMVLPTLPRVLGPLDRIRIPVTVFALEENLGEVKVSLNVTGPVRIVGDQERLVEFGDQDRIEVYFDVVAEEMIGMADMRITALSETSDYQNESRVKLPIRPYNPYIYFSTEKLADAGQTVEFVIPELGVAGTGFTQLAISSMRGLNINHRLKWLIRYPYGCIEQTTSAVFPQLYLPGIFNLGQDQLGEIDENVNAAIRVLREFQLSDGGFSYWPNGGYVDQWGTNYAGHFMLEAQELGYHVPADLLDNWVTYQTRAARENRGDSYTRAYRLYLLALADRPVLSAMNYMRESELDELSNPAKSLLAAAYQLMGYREIREEILEMVELDVEEYSEFSGTFGSSLRDKAVMLEVFTMIADYAQGLLLYNEIAEEISSNEWYSTQTTAYSLLALSKHVAAISKSNPVLTGVVTFPDLTTSQLEFGDVVATIPVKGSGGDIVAFQNTSEMPLFVNMEWEGIPQRGNIAPEQSRLTLQTGFYDQAGAEVSVDQLKQGESFYAVFRVGQLGHESINEVALVQILPAGWEIENLRLLGGQLPDWTNQYNLAQEEYVDIRDDRIMWFFDMEGYVGSYDFIVKLNAITVGEFYLPPTLLEAMYNNKYKVTTAGREVEVEAR